MPQGEQMLTDRLLNLSPEEMRILLCKYFRKVVDLREAGRKMEKVISDLDVRKPLLINIFLPMSKNRILLSQNWEIKLLKC